MQTHIFTYAAVFPWSIVKWEPTEEPVSINVETYFGIESWLRMPASGFGGIEHVETPNLLMTHDSWPRLRFHIQGRLCHNLCFWYWTLLSLGESERGPSGWVHSLTVAASCRNSRVGLPRTWVWLGQPRATSLLHLLPQNQYFPLIIWNMSRKSTCKRFRWSYN